MVLFNTLLRDKGVHAFLENICPKVNVIALLEFELTLMSLFRWDIRRQRTSLGTQHISMIHSIQLSYLQICLIIWMYWNQEEEEEEEKKKKQNKKKKKVVTIYHNLKNRKIYWRSKSIETDQTTELFSPARILR